MGAWIEILALAVDGEPLQSLPSWERGLKWIWYRDNRRNKTVAPLVGAWIEMEIWLQKICIDTSLPSWERGLKYPVCVMQERAEGRSPRGSVD